MSEKHPDLPEPAPGPTDTPEDSDVEGHNFEYGRQVAHERARADEKWARDEALRREARGSRRSLRDRLRGR